MSGVFELAGGGLGVMADPDDNAAQHDVPHHESGTRISFQVTNLGDGPGSATVSVELDGSFVADWTSQQLAPDDGETGFVSLGRLAEGDHSVLASVSPGTEKNNQTTNDFSVG